MVGGPSCLLARKLKLLKEDLRNWNRKFLGDLFFKKLVLLTKRIRLKIRNVRMKFWLLRQLKENQTGWSLWTMEEFI